MVELEAFLPSAGIPETSDPCPETQRLSLQSGIAYPTERYRISNRAVTQAQVDKGDMERVRCPRLATT